MGLRFLPVTLADMRELGDRPAIFLAYLKLLSKYADADGYVMRSTAQIDRDLSYGRRIQELCKKKLVNSGRITVRVRSKRSPTLEFRIEGYEKLRKI